MSPEQHEAIFEAAAAQMDRLQDGRPADGGGPEREGGVLKRLNDTRAAAAAKQAENASGAVLEGALGGRGAMGPVLGAFTGGGGSQ